MLSESGDRYDTIWSTNSSLAEGEKEGSIKLTCFAKLASAPTLTAH